MSLLPKAPAKVICLKKISKHGWLISGGTVSRATLIYDNAKKTGGLLSRFDYTGFDEVQSITFEQPGQIQQALKHYIRNGTDITKFNDGDTQEFGMRASTENIAAIVGMAETLRVNCDSLIANTEHITEVEHLFLNVFNKEL